MNASRQPAGRLALFATAFSAGAALPLGFAPYCWWPLAIVSPAALLWLLRTLPPRRAALTGWVFGLGMFGHGVWWIQVSVHQFGIPYYLFSVTTTAVFIAGMALYPAFFALLLSRVMSRAPGRGLVAAPGLWVLLEWVRSWFLSGFPWLSLGYSQVDGPLAGLAPVGGVFGLSFVLMTLAAGLVSLPAGGWRARGIALTAALAVVVATGLAGRTSFTSATGDTLAATLVQGAIPQQLKWQPALRERTIELYRELSEAHWTDDVIVWPETAIAAFPDDVETTLAALSARARDSDTALLVGMPTGKPREGEYFNSLVKLGHDPGRYDKRHLVPFGEYFPLGEYLTRLARLLQIPLSDFSPGSAEQAAIRVKGHAISVTICYEDAFGNETRPSLPQAGLLVNVSNDAWFGDTIAPHQHLQIARMRALETGRWMLRGTNTGISAVIDHSGRLVARAPAFVPATASADVSVRRGTTPYVRYGETPVLLLAGICLAAGVVSARGGRGTRAR